MAEFAAIGKTSFKEVELVKSCHPLFEYLWRGEREAIFRIVHIVLDKLNELNSDKVIIKKLKDREWQIVHFDFKKSSAKLLMDLADTIEDTTDLDEFFREYDRQKINSP